MCWGSFLLGVAMLPVIILVVGGVVYGLMYMYARAMGMPPGGG